MTIDTNLQEFVRRIEELISVANKKRQEVVSAGGGEWLVKSYDTLIENLVDLRSTASADKLPRPSRGETRPGAGLGLSRAVGEWCEDDELLDRVRSVEDYFRHTL
ncbi:hypothetical protein [Burkholderia sp. F1]|uniref:hypothetical protein n=1 Tax=Burkholderia sp. F1 TaxID=3366817 RepID=UPI003D7489F4